MRAIEFGGSVPEGATRAQSLSVCRCCVSLFGLSLLLLWAGVAHAATGPRLALVIGNAAYSNEAPLVNTLNDARDMAGRLEALGFEVTRVENANRRELARAANEFQRRLRGTSDSVALFYYSGHGMQVNGQNYLVPVDAQISDELDVPTEGLSVNRILAGLGDRGDKALNLVILDACRNNPFKKKDGSKSIGDKGLARVSAPGGTLILYATRPEETASDNPQGRNGLFTEHLLAEMAVPGVSVEQVFKRASERVFERSGRKQDPWMEGRIRGEFYFLPAALGQPRQPAGGTAQPLPAVQPNLELEVWRAADGCGTQACLQAYLDRYPQGVFAAIARARIAALTEQPAPVVAAPAADAVLKEQLKQCEVHLAANRLTTGQGGTALDCYREVLAREPANAQAQAGLERIVDRYIGWGRAALERGDVARAKGHLEKALQVQPGSDAARALGEAIAAKETALAQASEREAQAAAERRRQAEAQRARERAERARDTTLTGELVAIPGGCFEMGSPASEAGRDDDEGQHRVCVESFRIGKTEVSQVQWRAVMGSNPSDNMGCDDCPVARVTWYDVQEFLAKLNSRTGSNYRLPTEAEWEYACRGGRSGETYCGGNDVDAVAWYGGNSGGKTRPVGRKRANGYGLYDMSGNVWEWTCSEYDAGYRGGETSCIGKDNANGRQLVYRGGSWFSLRQYVRSANRAGATPNNRDYNFGFRLAQD